MLPYRIDVMTAAHLDGLLLVQEASFPALLCESSRVFHDRILRMGAHCRTVLQGEAVVGYVLCFPWVKGDTPINNEPFPEQLPAPDCFYLHDMALLPEARGTGIAEQLLKEVCHTGRMLGFDTLALVAIGQSGGYWDRRGFEPQLVTSHKMAQVEMVYGPHARLMMRSL